MAKTLGDLRDDVARRLGDPSHKAWTAAEIEAYLKTAYQQLAIQTRMFWDQAYVDLTAGTSTYTLPSAVVEIERATWDRKTLAATTPMQARRRDSRYELTQGEPYSYMWRQDGARTLRLVTVPSTPADVTHPGETIAGEWGIMRESGNFASGVTGTWGVMRYNSLHDNADSELWGNARSTHSWGIPRVTSEITDGTPFGTWGIPREIPGHMPLSNTTFWGTLRLFYTDDKNLKIEHWREGVAMAASSDVCELPDRYALYLRDYAQARCLAQAGPGQDLKLSAHYDERWKRGIARVTRRLAALDKNRVGRLGEPAQSVSPVPRPVLPYNYPQYTR